MKTFLRQLLALYVLCWGCICNADPAPQLTELRVYEIVSPLGGTETILPYQFTTARGHAGNTITFKTTERGIGYSTPNYGQIAKLNGITLSWSTRRGIVEDGITVGWEYEWTYTGAFVTGGYFEYRNMSINSPYTIKETYINILPYYPPPVFASGSPQYFYSEYTRFAPPTPASYQFQAIDPSGLAITFSIENAAGGPLTGNVQISPNGMFTWDGTYSSMFTRSTSCPYPYFAQINIVARNSQNAVARMLVSLQVMYGPLPPCAPPPPGPGN